MKKILLAIIVSWFSIGQISVATNSRIYDNNKIKNRLWERMISAITYVESRNDDRALNKKSGAFGRFQMKKIYVDDVNRILKLQKKKQRYTYADRGNYKKAREMFDIIQSHYNPEKEIDKAIILHRGKKSKSYINEVKNRMCQ